MGAAVDPINQSIGAADPCVSFAGSVSMVQGAGYERGRAGCEEMPRRGVGPVGREIAALRAIMYFKDTPVCRLKEHR